MNGGDNMSCSSCKYLKTSDKSKGAVCGYCYYCSKVNSYVNGSNDNCSDYETSYGRSTYICNQIYEDGEHYYNDSTPISVYVVILVILSILAFIFNIG